MLGSNPQPLLHAQASNKSAISITAGCAFYFHTILKIITRIAWKGNKTPCHQASFSREFSICL